MTASRAKRQPEVVVVDDDPAVLATLREGLEEEGFHVRVAGDYAAAEALVDDDPPDAALVDLYLGDGPSGLDLIEHIHASHPEVRCGLITGYGTFADAAEAVARGATFLLEKPVPLARLCRALRGREPAPGDIPGPSPSGLVGSSPVMRRLRETIGRMAATQTPVLIRGETGAGKELVARALHEQSPRAAGPFVAVNCMAIAKDLLESELFGHVRGTFTGADQDRPGLFREASGGTLFLDEVGDMPVAFQGKLLRVLELGRVRPVGGRRDEPVDVRVLAATHRDLDARVREGRFRQDLRYRIDILRLEVPPLRDRAEDLDELVAHLLARAVPPGEAPPRLTPPVLAALRAYRWPGNVRELRNVLEHIRVHAGAGEVELAHLPAEVREGARRAPRPGAAAVQPLGDLERRQVMAALEATGGNKRQAARLLGIDRSTLYRKLKRWGA